MRQVPFYGIVGDGRLATHFSHYLKLLGVSYSSWSRQEAKSHQVRPLDTLKDCEVIFLAIKDSEIESFIQSHPELLRKKLIHCSGSLETPLALGFHPLMTFTQDTLYPLSTYQEMAFVGTAPEAEFRNLFPSFPNSYVQISKEQKALYHALCVLGGNFTTLLGKKMISDLSRLGVSEKASQLYLSQTLSNLFLNPKTALTGPLQRKDQKTIKKNLEALKEDPYQEVYQAFVHAVSKEEAL